MATYTFGLNGLLRNNREGIKHNFIDFPDFDITGVNWERRNEYVLPNSYSLLKTVSGTGGAAASTHVMIKNLSRYEMTYGAYDPNRILWYQYPINPGGIFLMPLTRNGVLGTTDRIINPTTVPCKVEILYC